MAEEREEERLLLQSWNQDVSNGGREVEELKYFGGKSNKLGDELGQGKNDVICKHIKMPATFWI